MLRRLQTYRIGIARAPPSLANRWLDKDNQSAQIESMPYDPQRAAGARGKLSELQQIQVERLLAAICKPHPDPKVNAMVRKGYRVEGAAVVLFESRPAFLAPHDWQDLDVAKFRFNKSRGIWQLFCQFRDLRWRAYEPLPESPDLSELLAEVEKDPTGIFWG